MKRLTFLLIVAFAVSAMNLSAEVHMSPLFTDNMVMQQKSDAPVWGTATPGASVTVVPSWNKVKYSVFSVYVVINNAIEFSTS